MKKLLLLLVLIPTCLQAQVSMHIHYSDGTVTVIAAAEMDSVFFPLNPMNQDVHLIDGTIVSDVMLLIDSVTFSGITQAPPTCLDGILNNGELAPDCGGPCPPCGTCDDGVQSEIWVPSLQQFFMEAGVDCGFPCPWYCPPTCQDGIQNGNETGIDCGGALCPPCPPPTCSDNAWNGLETGVDCGGPLCPPCPIATCNDGIQNQGETGIDCGGPCPNDCPPPTCFDGVQNQGEYGIDCGGPCPTICPPPNCNDGVLNNGEEWIDCGGPCPNICPNCSDGIQNGPEAGVDCVLSPIPEYSDGFCDLCQSCFDGVQNQLEFGVDCGGPFCPPCTIYLNAVSLNGFPFIGDNISVTVIGINVIISGSQTLSGQTRTLTLTLPLNLVTGGTAGIVSGPGAPSAEYNQFGTNFLSIQAGSGDCNYDLHNINTPPGSMRIEGGIDVITFQNGLPPMATFVNATGITFGINY